MEQKSPVGTALIVIALGTGMLLLAGFGLRSCFMGTRDSVIQPGSSDNE